MNPSPSQKPSNLQPADPAQPAAPDSPGQKSGEQSPAMQSTQLSPPPGQPAGSGRLVHSFSRRIADEYGIPSALLLRYLAYRVERSRKVRDGRRWHYETVAELAARYPYLGHSTIHNALQGLRGPVLLIDSFNRWPSDRTSWYAFQSDTGIASAKSDLLYFQPEYALQCGIPAALVLHNVSYWLNENRKKDPEHRWQKVSISRLSKLLLLSRKTIERALGTLVSAGLLVPNPDRSGRDPEYSLPTLAQEALPELEMLASNLDVTASNLDDITYYRNHVVDPVGETCWEETRNRYPYRGLPAEPSPPGIGTRPVSGNTSKPDQLLPTPAPAAPASVEIGNEKATEGALNHPQVHPAGEEAETSAGSKEAQSSQALVTQGNSTQAEQASNPLHPEATYEGFRQQTMTMRQSFDLDVERQFQERFYLCAAFFLQSIPDEVLIEWNALRSHEALWQALGPRVEAHDDRYLKLLEPVPRSILRQLVRLCIVEAHRWGWDSSLIPTETSIQAISVILHQRREPFYERQREMARQARERQQTEELDRRRQAHRSPLEGSECDATLPAARKVDVLRAALISRSRIGYRGPKETIIDNFIVVRHSSLAAAERFFAANPELPAGALIRIVDGCIALHESWAAESVPPPEEGEFDPHFYARRAFTLSFLLLHLDKLLDLVNLDDLPRIHTLDRMALFGSSSDVPEG